MAPVPDPTLPVIVEIPVLLTAPVVVNKTKFAAVPKSGACARMKEGEVIIVTTVTIKEVRFFFIGRI